MEFWVGAALKLFDILAWPLSIIILILVVRDRFQDIFVKHGGTELMLKSTVKQKLDSVAKKQSAMVSKREQKIVTETLEEVRKIFVEKAEGFNTDGRFRRFSNGNVIQQIRIPEGKLEGKKTFQFPASDFDDDCIQVTIVGTESPSIRELTRQSITLELQDKNSGEIILNILGTSDL